MNEHHPPHPGGLEYGDIFMPAASGQEIAEKVPFVPGRVIPHRLLDAPQVRVVHIALDDGQELKEHMAPFGILVQVMSGSIDFEVNDERIRMDEGGLIHLPPKLLHAVTAVGPARIQITLLKTGN
ncbi:cupin domain-containing protein [Jonesiaceae bacterium BS-20]|uniref:Cupin domain-containing protein n=1 Tax=Jonesiaceae bacterium BS-20 TaxID=3120821 RepID=A0AAU7DT86_9MICO